MDIVRRAGILGTTWKYLGINMIKMPDLDDMRGWQQFIMNANFELAQSEDLDVRAKALDRLQRTSIVGLNVAKVQINLANLETADLKDRLTGLVDRINARQIELN